jgi:site-specific DNA-methyltransferase (adenine-specific)
LNSRPAIFSLDGLSDIKVPYRNWPRLPADEVVGQVFNLPCDSIGKLKISAAFVVYNFAAAPKMSAVTAFDFRLQDCIPGMSRLAAGSVDLVVTSPPYNLGVKYSRYSDKLDRSSYLLWCNQWAAQVQRVLKRTGSFFLNIGSAPSNPMLPHELALAFRKFFSLQNTIHWIKSISIEDRDGEIRSHGHFKPVSSQRFLNDCHEYVFHFTETGRIRLDRRAIGVPYQDKSNIARWSHTRGSDLRCRGNTWFIPYETIQSRAKERPHPATFPVQLAEWCIKLHGIPRIETMLDPFLGIGNSAIAAKNCGIKRFIGFEIDKTYLAEAKRRLGPRVL